MIPTLIVCLSFIIISITTLYFHITRNFNHWKNKNVQYLKPIPLFGNFYVVSTLQLSIGEFLHDLYNKTTLPFFGFFVFDKPFLLIRDPEIIKGCLVKDFEHFSDRSITDNIEDDEMGSSLLFTLKNPTWRSVRVRVDPAYATGKMKRMLPLILEATDDLVDYINNKAIGAESTETKEISMKFTTDVISSCGFGINPHCFLDENSAFREVSHRLFDWNFSRKISMASYFFAPFLVKLFKMKFLEPNCVKFIDDVVKTVVADREKLKISRGDFIDALIHIRDQNRHDSYHFDDKMLAAQSAQFFSAGFETAGSAIAFALYELSLNKSIQNRLREEICKVIRKHEGISYLAIQEMNYLDMTIRETLRKYPVLSFLGRYCTKPYKIPGTDVVIEKGVPIYISLFGLHFDSKYFPKPEKFDPDRFNVENKSTRPSFCYMPFGEGPRNCIGARLGMLIVKVALIRIIAEFEVDVCKTTQVPLKWDPKGFPLCPENGIFLSFRKKM